VYLLFAGKCSAGLFELRKSVAESFGGQVVIRGGAGRGMTLTLEVPPPKEKVQ
jgi:signal transduction histidine kinase